MDKARKLTDKRLLKMEREINNVYNDAISDVTAQWDSFMSDSNKKLANIQKALETPNMNADDRAQLMRDYQKELQKQTFKNKKYNDMVNSLAVKLENTSEIAVKYANGQLPYIYSVNYNQLAEDTKIFKGFDFELVDEYTVKNMIKDNPNLLPFKKVNAEKAVKWNKKLINSQVLQGILQGESIPKIAARIEHVTEASKDSAIRAARTMTTAAENKGRQSSYNKAEEMGLKIQKEWIATLDDRTRASHVQLNGVRVAIDEDFPNGLEYPADSSGDPSEVYNCRCTMRAIFPKNANAKANVTGNTKITYNKWVKEQEKLKREKKIEKIRKGK